MLAPLRNFNMLANKPARGFSIARSFGFDL
jgi:hypothetical protein